MGCYGSLSPVLDNESLSHWNESLCVEMSRYEVTRVVGHPPETFAKTRSPCVCWVPRCPWSKGARCVPAHAMEAWRLLVNMYFDRMFIDVLFPVVTLSISQPASRPAAVNRGWVTGLYPTDGALRVASHSLIIGRRARA